MSDLLTQTVVNTIERVEAVLQATMVEAAGAREAAMGAQAQVNAESEREAREVAARSSTQAHAASELAWRLRRVAKLPRGAPVGKARTFPSDAESGCVTYLALFESTERQVQELVGTHDRWDEKGALGKLAARAGKPRMWASELGDDVETLREWVPHIELRQIAMVRAAAEQQLAHVREDLAATLQRITNSESELLEQARQDLAALHLTAPVTALGWEDPQWGPDAVANTVRGDLRIGVFDVKAPSLVRLPPAPATLAFPFSSSLVIDGTGANRAPAIEIARALCARLLAAVPPGKVRFTFVDPIAIGQSVAEFQHLADYNAEIVDTRPITMARDIEERLQSLSSHIETVISKYLRGQFSSIDQYNNIAGEVAEPYRILVVFDYPAGFSATAAQQLLSLVENGPRCGLHTIVVTDEAREQPRDLALSRLKQGCQLITWQTSPRRMRLRGPLGDVAHAILPDPPPLISFDPSGIPTSPIAMLLAAFGQGVRDVGNAEVTLDRLLPVLARAMEANRSANLPVVAPGTPSLTLDPATWWNATTERIAVAPIGRSGAQEVTSMYFSSTEIAGGAILIGLPRSGKSTSLHAAILTMCILYPPDEVELYLLDNKHGVEFKAYDCLPHARMVSINSEREFSVAVLKSIDAEIARRAELMKSVGKVNITEYRQATGEKMSRIVVVMDEFHELFEEDDRTGREAFEAFSNIVRQGPAFGAHLVVSSQTLSSMPALDRATLQLLPQRIAFMCNESDADVVMGDANRGTRLLNKQGEGLFNASRGEPSKNIPFQGMLITADERASLITCIRRKAATNGFGALPRVFNGDSAAIRPAGTVALGAKARLQIPIGEPFSLEQSEVVTLRRTRGSNVLVVGDADDEGARDMSVRAVLHSFIAHAREAGVAVAVIDYVGDEDVVGGLTVMEVAKSVGARYTRSRGATEVLGQVAREAQVRVDAEDYAGSPLLLVLFGAHRAISLTPIDPYSDDGSLAASDAALLSEILKTGPEVGIHTVLSAESAKAVERRIGADLLAEFTLCLAGSGASLADLSFAAGTYGDVPEVRRNQILIGDRLRGKTVRVRGYLPLTAAT